mmetsp:Transcript_6568/g.26747  ORF Transcript_6568/g.26747 Transcript_6568/m.26747 type:complete len:334 (-) Transcript_6568:1150-2151(-)
MPRSVTIFPHATTSCNAGRALPPPSLPYASSATRQLAYGTAPSRTPSGLRHTVHTSTDGKRRTNITLLSVKIAQSPRACAADTDASDACRPPTPAGADGAPSTCAPLVLAATAAASASSASLVMQGSTSGTAPAFLPSSRHSVLAVRRLRNGLSVSVCCSTTPLASAVSTTPLAPDTCRETNAAEVIATRCSAPLPPPCAPPERRNSTPRATSHIATWPLAWPTSSISPSASKATHDAAAAAAAAAPPPCPPSSLVLLAAASPSGASGSPTSTTPDEPPTATNPVAAQAPTQTGVPRARPACATPCASAPAGSRRTAEGSSAGARSSVANAPA